MTEKCSKIVYLYKLGDVQLIKFYGLISDDNQKVIVRQEKSILFFASLVTVLIFGALTIFVAIYVNLIFLLFFIPLIFFLTIPLFPVSKKTLDSMIPLQVDILENVVVSSGENFKCTRLISDIKKVVDCGSYYQILFKWPKKTYKFLCQKDLIAEGSIEDFEKKFDIYKR